MNFDPKIHHRRSIRLKDYDYAQPGAYFITIVIYNRQCLLSIIQGGKLMLIDPGIIVKQEWEKLPWRFPSIQNDSFVVMPNHFHGIIIINPTTREINSPTSHKENFERFGHPTKRSIPTIVRSFKSSTTLQYRRKPGRLNAQFWQSGYFEHVIRDENDLNRIRDYIDQNPDTWMFDKEYCGPC